MGVGTIWYGMRWPIENDEWIQPNINEVSSVFNKILDNSTQGVLVDTAPSYKKSESMLGNALSLLKPDSRARVVMSTKVGEYYSNNKKRNIIDFSIDQIHKSLKNSHKLLGDLHIIYMHVTSNLSVNRVSQKLLKSLIYILR